ncbi:class I SAM-dependent methyltransferase [Methylobacterium nodulans]|uniref:Methyltransferase type 11 n=1 Tax=Methylobacterium nodulans (strain LMG 21967 / CNCM I-2342 / ORS 2060) TaxID=460265 RepID=B8INN6_METNO|nr:methyltransferase domain-containing protein [Methylobacterium nodulans]ACL58402.1 Methyltransferase type 11 [Methylobacterium nodulans ORS 2060]
MTADLEPDQQAARWNDHVCVYESVFEPFTNRFAERAIEALLPTPGTRCLDVAAGTGGAALRLAARGAEVLAVDAAPAMCARICTRAASLGLPVTAAAMDAERLALPDHIASAALSIFGIILCPDPARALREMARVVRPGGQIALVTWTEPQHYELAARLIAASAAVRGTPARPASLPAQLRFREEAAFRGLFAAAGLTGERVERIEAPLQAPSARWLAARLAFAPGMAAMLAGQGEEREAVLARFVAELERDSGTGPVALRAVAFLGAARCPG